MKSLGKGVVTWSYQQYRANAEKEYESFWMALFRELIQNSNDAGASNIIFWLKNDKQTIEVADDGRGMDLDTILNKLLVIGGSHKDEGAVGGLGKAKELLFFSQPRWTITTNNHTIDGIGGEYEVFESSDKYNGTIITLTQPDDVNIKSAYYSLKKVATRCELKATIYGRLDNHEMVTYPTIYPKGRMIRDIDELGKLYHRKSFDGEKIKDKYHMRVQVNGCWMFDRWIGHHHGAIVLDIDSRVLHPVEGLTANRDALKSKYAQSLDTIVSEIIVDKRSALVRREATVTLLEGNGAVYTNLPTESAMERMYDSLMKMNSDEIGQLLDADADAFDINVERLAGMLGENESADTLRRFSHIIDYKPDFAIYEDPDNDEWNHGRIQKFMKTQKAATIAKVWTETVKQVLLDNEIETRFVAGFLFSREEEAMLRRTDDTHTLYINPIMVPPTGVQNKVQFMHYMRTTAVHEITHFNQRYHDEYFMAHYHKLEYPTWGSHRIYSKIGKLR